MEKISDMAQEQGKPLLQMVAELAQASFEDVFVPNDSSSKIKYTIERVSDEEYKIHIKPTKQKNT